MKRFLSCFAVIGAAFSMLILFVGLAAPASAENPEGAFDVNSTTDAVDVNPGDGVCETGVGNNVCTLRAAIMEANNLAGADMIMVPAGTYTLTLVGDDADAAVGDLDLRQSVEIVGAGFETTIIDGDTIDRIFEIQTPSSHTVKISGITMRNGNGPSGGGLCNCTAGTIVEITNSSIENSYAPNLGGGGIRNFGTMSITNTLIIGNGASTYAGGISNEVGATMMIYNSTIADNIATFDGLGGGIGNEGVLTITNSTVWSNTVEFSSLGATGGGIDNNGSGQLWLTNSTVYGNFAYGAGGGILNRDSGYITVTNSTIFSNSISNVNGAFNIIVQGGTMLFRNSIVAGGTGDNCTGNIISEGYNIDSGDTCGFNATGDMVNTDPLLESLQDNGGPTLTNALLEGSPAIDSANASVCPTEDQRGVERPIDGDGDTNAVCDIGAFEFGKGIEVVFKVYLPIILNP